MKLSTGSPCVKVTANFNPNHDAQGRFAESEEADAATKKADAMTDHLSKGSGAYNRKAEKQAAGLHKSAMELHRKAAQIAESKGDDKLASHHRGEAAIHSMTMKEHNYNVRHPLGSSISELEKR